MTSKARQISSASHLTTKRDAIARAALLALLASASPLAITPAYADAAATPAAAPATPAPETSANEIVVTATKRAENLQNVPISIIALTSDTLTQHQVNNFDDYAKILPSVSYQSFGPGQTQLNFRGITSGGDGIAIGPLPTAGLYINETPVTTIYGAADLHIYDMDHVEALSGPQGTLYGASSLAGTLRLITKAPKIGKWEAGIDGEINKFGPGSEGGKAQGFINIPINDSAALRVVGYYEHDGGYISNSPASRTYQRGNSALNDGSYYTGTSANPIYGAPYYDSNGNQIIQTNPITVNNAAYVKRNFNTVDQFGGRAALKIDLDEHWTATPMVIYQHQIAKGTYLFNDPNNQNYSQGYDPGWGAMQVHDFTPDHNRDAWYLASLTLQGKISDWDVTYNGSYFGRQADTVADYSYFSVAYDGLSTAPGCAPNSPCAAIPGNPSGPNTLVGYDYFTDASGNNIDPTQTFHQHDSYTKFSQEFRVSSPSDKPFRLTAGLFMQRQTDRHTADYIVPGLSSSQQYTTYPWQIAGAPADDVYYTNANRIDRDYAAFAEGTWEFAHDLTLIAGIRGFIADNTLSGYSGSAGALGNAASSFGCAVVTVEACPNIRTNGTNELKYVEAGETHKAELKWQIEPGKMVYAIYSTGFRPGGNNRSSYFNGKYQIIPPFKADTLTNYEIGWKTSWLNRTLYLDGALFWEDWHKMQYSEPGIQGIYYTVNAGNARSRGIEGSLSWRPMHGLSISANGTYVDAKLTTPFCSTVTGCYDPVNNPNGVTLAPAGTRLPITPRLKGNTTARYEWAMGSYKTFLQGGINRQSNTTSYLTTAGESVLRRTAGFTTVDFSGGLSRDSWTLTAFITNAFDKRGILSKNSECAPSICGGEARLYPTKPQEFGLQAGYRF